MTTEELQYLYQYIKNVVNEYLALKTEDERRELLASTFEDRHMQNVTGQQFLTQKTFRAFLDEVQFVSDREYINTKFDELWIKCLTEIAGRVISQEQYNAIAKERVEYIIEDYVKKIGVPAEGSDYATLFQLIEKGGGSIDPESLKGLAKETEEYVIEDSLSVICQHIHNGNDEADYNCIKCGEHWYSYTARAVENEESGAQPRFMYEWITFDKTATHKRVYTITNEVSIGGQYYTEPNTELSPNTIDDVDNDQIAKKSDLTNLATKDDLNDVAKKGDLADMAKAGTVAKTLDDIKVDIPTDIATESSKGAIESVANKIHESVGEDPVAPVGDEPRPNLHQKMYMLAGMIGKKGDAELGEESLYAEVETVATTTNGKLDQILAAVTLNAAQADEDWQNVKPA